MAPSVKVFLSPTFGTGSGSETGCKSSKYHTFARLRHVCPDPGTSFPGATNRIVRVSPDQVTRRPCYSTTVLIVLVRVYSSRVWNAVSRPDPDCL